MTNQARLSMTNTKTKTLVWWAVASSCNFASSIALAWQAGDIAKDHGFAAIMVGVVAVLCLAAGTLFGVAVVARARNA